MKPSDILNDVLYKSTFKAPPTQGSNNWKKLCNSPKKLERCLASAIREIDNLKSALQIFNNNSLILELADRDFELQKLKNEVADLISVLHSYKNLDY